MTKTPTHTPTPWIQNGPTIEANKKPAAIIGRAIFECFTIKHYYGIGDEEGTANAEFIVRAVNAHDQMVAILKSILPMMTNHSIGGENAFNVIKQAIALATKDADPLKP